MHTVIKTTEKHFFFKLCFLFLGYTDTKSSYQLGFTFWTYRTAFDNDTRTDLANLTFDQKDIVSNIALIAAALEFVPLQGTILYMKTIASIHWYVFVINRSIVFGLKIYNS